MNLGRTGAVAAALAAMLVLPACGGGGGSGETASLPAGCTETAKPPPKDIKLKAPNKPLKPSAHLAATVTTNCGTFVFALDAKRAPVTAGSFVYLVGKGLYEDTLIHRIQPGFVIQGGDPLGTGVGGPGYTVDEKPPGSLAYTHGTVAMARTAAEPPGRSGSQFFVVTAADAGLDPSYALLGKVTAGLDVVDRIGQLGTPAGVPTATVVIKKITVATG
jgi:peptidyl-prolyl cis-trans isomerase B (cyclophilin B)